MLCHTNEGAILMTSYTNILLISDFVFLFKKPTYRKPLITLTPILGVYRYFAVDVCVWSRSSVLIQL